MALIFSFTGSRTSGSSLVYPTLTPVRAILLQAAASRKQLYCAPWQLLSNTTQHSLVLSSLFLNFHLKRFTFLWATMRPDSFVVETFRSLFKVPLWSNSRYPFFYIFIHNRSFLDFPAKFQSITNIRTRGFWTFISENLRPPLISLVPSLGENLRKWRHFLKNTTRVEIIEMSQTIH